MKEKADIYEWIESFLAGQLKGEQLAEFESQLKTDPDFARQVQLHRELADSFGDPNRDNLSNILTDLGQEFTQAPTKKTRPLWASPRFRAIAAAIAVIFSIGILINLWPSKVNPQELFAQYYEAYPAQGNLRSLNPALDSLWLQGAKRYNDQKYAEAIPLFQQIVKLEQTNSSASFFLGLSLLAENRLEESSQALSIVITDETSLFRDQATWYQALIDLKQGKLEASKATLSTLSQKSGKYATLANDLLEKLD